MPTEDDNKIAEILFERELLTKEQIKECLTAQLEMEKHGIVEPFLDIVIKKNLISKQQAASLKRSTGSSKQPIEGYELLTKLGQGGMGAVYKAKQTSMDRTVALKVMSPKLAKDKEFAERFMREARAVAKFSHPNIIGGIDVGNCKNIYYFAMEFVDGKSVQNLIDEKGKLASDQVIDIALQSAQGLEHAHSKSIIHRDIKPDNILIAKKDSVAKLADLGLAKATDEDSSLTATGTAFGTPNYISPEQARGLKDIDGRTDIYSLGATMYHMITGNLLFTGETAAVVMTKHINEAPVPPIKVNPATPPHLNTVILKMLEKDRNKRYQNCTEVIEDLEAIKKGMTPPNASGKKKASAPAAAPAPAPAPAKTSEKVKSKPEKTPGKKAKDKNSKEDSASKQRSKRRSESKQETTQKSGILPIIVGIMLVLVIGGIVFLFIGNGDNKNDQSENNTKQQTNNTTPRDNQRDPDDRNTNTPRPDDNRPSASDAWKDIREQRENAISDVQSLGTFVDKVEDFVRDYSDYTRIKQSKDLLDDYKGYHSILSDAKDIDSLNLSEQAESYTKLSKNIGKLIENIKSNDEILVPAIKAYQDKVQNVSKEKLEFVSKIEKYHEGFTREISDLHNAHLYGDLFKKLDSYPNEYKITPWKEEVEKLKKSILVDASSYVIKEGEEKINKLKDINNVLPDDFQNAKFFLNEVIKWDDEETTRLAEGMLTEVSSLHQEYKKHSSGKSYEELESLLGGKIAKAIDGGRYYEGIKVIDEILKKSEGGEARKDIEKLKLHLETIIEMWTTGAENYKKSGASVKDNFGIGLGKVTEIHKNGIFLEGNKKIYTWDKLKSKDFAKMAADSDEKLEEKFGFAQDVLSYYKIDFENLNSFYAFAIQVKSELAPNSSSEEYNDDRELYRDFLIKRVEEYAEAEAEKIYNNALEMYHAKKYQDCLDIINQLKRLYSDTKFYKNNFE